jgi:hypothetical protein
LSLLPQQEKQKSKDRNWIYVNRGLYQHFGIYNNDESVIHFSPDKGKEISPEDAYIRETILLEFLKGGDLEIDHSVKQVFSPDEIVHRARSLVGTNLKKYNLLSFNCEHFAFWCATGKLRSKQVETGVAIAGGVALAATAAILIKYCWIKMSQRMEGIEKRR